VENIYYKTKEYGEGARLSQSKWNASYFGENKLFVYYFFDIIAK